MSDERGPLGIEPENIPENGIKISFDNKVAAEIINQAKVSRVKPVLNERGIPGLEINTYLHSDDEGSLIFSLGLEFSGDRAGNELRERDFLDIFQKMEGENPEISIEYDSVRGIPGLDEIKLFVDYGGGLGACHMQLADMSPETMALAIDTVGRICELAFESKGKTLPSNGELKLKKPAKKEDPADILSKIFGKEDERMGHVDMEQYLVDPNTIWERLDDVVGQPEAQSYAESLIRAMKYPNLVSSMGMEVNRFVMFEGDPGLGKTMMARAICGETNGQTNMYYVDIATLNKGAGLMGGLERTVGSVMNGTIKQAEENPDKYHILFIDEIDGVFGTGQYGTHRATEGAIRVLQQTIEGFNQLPQNFILIGSTNFPESFPDALRSRITEVGFQMPNDEVRQRLVDNFNDRQPRKVLNLYDESGKLTQETQGAMKGMSHREIMKSIRDLINMRVLELFSNAEKQGLNLDEIEGILANSDPNEQLRTLEEKGLLVEINTDFLVQYLPKTSAYRQKEERERKMGKKKGSIGFSFNSKI